MPPFRGHIRVTSCCTGKQWRYVPERGCSQEHCGGYRVRVEKAKICDYLGIFAFRDRKTKEQTSLVRPKDAPVSDLLDPQRVELGSWVPKAGGGFSENHEHRLYRPGDSLNQLHWKLSAKVGDLILREPMEPVRGAVLLTVSLRGDPETLDRKLGRLLWVGRYLLERELDFEVRALTGSGVLCALQDTVEKTFISDSVVGYIVRLVGATRTDPELQRGASPRATLAVAAMSKAIAQLRGRDYVVPADVREVFVQCVSHRLLLTLRAQTQGVTGEQVLQRILEAVPAPRLR